MTRVNYDAAQEVADAIVALGRTEDLMFSPNGTRLAILGFKENRVLLLDVDRTDGNGSSRALHFTRAVMVHSAGLSYPHGMAWIDDETIIVANREGHVTVFAIPEGVNASDIVLDPVVTIGSSALDHIRTPGSVAVRRLGSGVVEALVCNNYANTVTRHLLDFGQAPTLLHSEIVLRDGLAIPDGLAISADGRWLAVSNHFDHTVRIYEADRLGETESPAGVLSGMSYPHGLRFTPDSRALLVADAGRPVVHLFAKPSGDWTGARLPDDSIVVIDEPTFARGHYNPEEGGPKGLGVFLKLYSRHEA